MARFIVTLHEAHRAGKHHDIRFEMPRSRLWASFAVRKDIPTIPGKKVLAVRTHDHTRDEALFIGTIKKGYGAGRLKKFDDGSCRVIKFKEGHMAVDFKGRKLKGIYHFVNTGVIDKDYKKKTYLLFKGKI